MKTIITENRMKTIKVTRNTFFRKSFLALSILMLALSSCSKDEEETTTTTPPTDVYIAGSTLNSNNVKVPTIWKNGVPTILGSDANRNTVVNKIAVNGNDVYATAGYDGSNTILLWKNGISSVVSEGSSITYAKDLIVENNDIYILGRKGNTHSYWKNGIETILTNFDADFADNNMVVANGDVHIVGTEFINKSVVKYWKNGAATTISNPNIYSNVIDIDVNGADVTILFRESIAANNVVLKVWRNGTITTLESGLSYVGKGYIVTTPNTIYVTAQTRIDTSIYKIGFWKNGVKTNLTSGSTYASPFDMKITGNDVHIIGLDTDPISRMAILKYWKNGLETILSSGADGSFDDIAMAISKNGDVHIVGKKFYFLNNARTILEGNQPEAFNIFTVN